MTYWTVTMKLAFEEATANHFRRRAGIQDKVKDWVKKFHILCVAFYSLKLVTIIKRSIFLTKRLHLYIFLMLFNYVNEQQCWEPNKS